jgi:hypothetical protein
MLGKAQLSERYSTKRHSEVNVNNRRFLSDSQKLNTKINSIQKKNMAGKIMHRRRNNVISSPMHNFASHIFSSRKN